MPEAPENRGGAHAARAFLGAPLDRVAVGLREVARANGFPIEEEAHGLFLQLRAGTLRASAVGGRTALEITAPGPHGLQLLRDMLAERVSALGLALDWETRWRGGRPGNLSLARLAGLDRISPSYVRLRLEGPDLARFAVGGLHFRLLFGPEGADWPSTDAGGVTSWPGGLAAWHRPVYTTRAIETRGAAATITCDVFLHEGGRVTEWVLAARPGAEVALTGPNGAERPEAAWMGLVGDETALPVIARILAEAPPATLGTAVLFAPGAEDVQPLAHPVGMTVRWALRGAGETPLDALEGLDPPAADRFVFFAAERAEAAAARARLPQRGLGRGEFHASGYWTAPEA